MAIQYQRGNMCRHLNKMEMGIEEREAKKSSGLATLVSYHTRTLSLHMNT